MKFDQVYEVIREGASGKFRLQNKKTKKIIPELFESLDLSSLSDGQSSVVRATVSGKLKLFDLKEGRCLDYKISKWGTDSDSRFITMYLLSNNCAVFDTISKKLRILPKEITKTYISTFYEKNYLLVKMFSGDFTFYHLTKYHSLDVRYNQEEIKKVGYGLHWKDVITRSPKDIKHLPNSLAQNKKVLAMCYDIISNILKEKKTQMPKEEYLKYRQELITLYNNRVNSAFPELSKKNTQE